MGHLENRYKEELSRVGYKVFSDYKRPKHLTDHTHCEECADHDLALQNIDLMEFGPDQAGHIAWSPLPFMTASALGYFMPRLIEMALENSPNRDGDPFITDFIRLVSKDDPRFALYTNEQKSTIYYTLQYISTHFMNIIEQEEYSVELLSAISAWTDK